ncbi:hypothetical protein EZS27_005329 [termite gut metagenome]|uniref:Uncharacterized protein n=1 Tax=termite gut metagenome TaxID=433724 RepID=A0A5J4SPH8_9ZZZZ
MNTKEQLIKKYIKEHCTIPEPELAALRAKYGKIKILVVVIEPPVLDEEGNATDPGEVYYFAVRRPDPGHIGIIMKYAKNNDLDNYIGSFIKNLIVAGDLEALKNDGLVYLGLSSQMDELLKPYQVFFIGA